MLNIPSYMFMISLSSCEIFQATPRATLPQHGGGDVACGGGRQLPGASHDDETTKGWGVAWLMVLNSV